MKRNVVEMVLGAVVLVAALGFLVFSYSTADLDTVEGYSVTASFSEIGSLDIGSDVRMSGVRVGNVMAVDLDPITYLAQVTLALDPDLKLPDDTSAMVTSEGLLGGSFLALQPGGSEDYISDGGRIQYTQDAQNLEKLLGQFIFTLQDNDNEDG